MSSKSLSLGMAAALAAGGCDDESPLLLSSRRLSGLGIRAGLPRAFFLRAEAAALLLEGEEGATFVMTAAVCPEQRGGLGGGDAGRVILYGTATIRVEMKNNGGVELCRKSVDGAKLGWNVVGRVEEWGVGPRHTCSPMRCHTHGEGPDGLRKTSPVSTVRSRSKLSKLRK